MKNLFVQDFIDSNVKLSHTLSTHMPPLQEKNSHNWHQAGGILTNFKPFLWSVHLETRSHLILDFLQSVWRVCTIKSGFPHLVVLKFKLGSIRVSVSFSLLCKAGSSVNPSAEKRKQILWKVTNNALLPMLWFAFGFHLLTKNWINLCLLLEDDKNDFHCFIFGVATEVWNISAPSLHLSCSAFFIDPS